MHGYTLVRLLHSCSCQFAKRVVGSIHFSLLSGRILIKNVAYHSSNQTIRIVKGRIQWRYWNRRTMEESDVGKQGASEPQGLRPNADRDYREVPVSYTGLPARL